MRGGGGGEEGEAKPQASPTFPKSTRQKKKEEGPFPSEKKRDHGRKGGEKSKLSCLQKGKVERSLKRCGKLGERLLISQDLPQKGKEFGGKEGWNRRSSHRGRGEKRGKAVSGGFLAHLHSLERKRFQIPYISEAIKRKEIRNKEKKKRGKSSGKFPFAAIKEAAVFLLS